MSEPRTRQTEYVPLDELKPDPRNPKGHDLATIDSSVGRFGYIDSIVRDDRTGFIISGHGRAKTLTAMRDRGETPPEGIVTDEEGRWLIPVGVGWASRTDTEATAALIALNRTTELGGWVDDALLDMLDELSAMGEEGLLGVGFNEADRLALEHLANSQPVRDLDVLHGQYGNPTDDDSLVRVVLRLPADLADRLTAMTGSTPIEHEAAARRFLGDG